MSVLESFLATYGIVAIVLGTFAEGETVLLLAGLAAHQLFLGVAAAGSIVWFVYFAQRRRRSRKQRSADCGWRDAAP